MRRALLLVIFSLSISCTPGDIRGQSTTESPAVTTLTVSICTMPTWSNGKWSGASVGRSA